MSEYEERLEEESALLRKACSLRDEAESLKESIERKMAENDLDERYTAKYKIQRIHAILREAKELEWAGARLLQKVFIRDVCHLCEQRPHFSNVASVSESCDRLSDAVHAIYLLADDI